MLVPDWSGASVCFCGQAGGSMFARVALGETGSFDQPAGGEFHPRHRGRVLRDRHVLAQAGPDPGPGSPGARAASTMGLVKNEPALQVS